MKLACFDAATCWRSLCNKIVFLLSSVVNKLTYQTTSNQWRETSISRAARNNFEHFQNMSKCSEHALKILRCLLHLPWAHALPLAVELERYSREHRFWTSYRPVQSRSKDKQRHAKTRTWQVHDKDLQHIVISTIQTWHNTSVKLCWLSCRPGCLDCCPHDMCRSSNQSNHIFFHSHVACSCLQVLWYWCSSMSQMQTQHASTSTVNHSPR